MKPIHLATTQWRNDPEVSGIDDLSTEDREALTRIMDQYLAELETGLAPDLEVLLAEHPHLRRPLRAYAGSLQLLHRATNRVAASPRRGAGTSAVNLERTLGDYRLIREIGRGGMGVVYEAWQVSLDRRVALKVLPFAAVLDPKCLARFQNEVRAAAQLVHPHIVPVFGVGCDRGVHYFSMQYVDGQPLDRAVQELLQATGGPAPTSCAARGSTRTSPSDPRPRAATVDSQSFSTIRSIHCRDHVRRVARLGVQAAEALEHAHEFGITHRDVKPSNLLIDRQAKLWVTDFGLARIQSGAEITATGDLLGTVRYMSPEQAAGQHALVDHRTDIYSLGATLFELLTLRPAFPEEDRRLLLRQIERDQPPPLRRLNPAVPADLETIVLKAMSKSRDDRYARAADLADDLQRFLDGRPTLARRPSWWDRGSKWAARHQRLVAASAAVLVVGLFAASCALLVLINKERQTAAALDRAQRHLVTAKQVVDRFGAEMTEQLADIPAAAAVRAEMLAETLNFYEQLARYAESDPHLRRDVATAALKAAGAARQLGQLERAAELYDRARREFEQADPGSETTAALALCDSQHAQVLVALGEPARAQQLFRSAAVRQSALVARDPATQHSRDLAITHNNLGRLLLDEGRFQEAEACFESARRLLVTLRTPADADPRLHANLGGVLNNLGLALEKQDRLVEAERVLAEAVAEQQLALRQAPDSERIREFLGKHLANRLRVLRRMGSNEQADRTARQLEQLRGVTVALPDAAEGTFTGLGAS